MDAITPWLDALSPARRARATRILTWIEGLGPGLDVALKWQRPVFLRDGRSFAYLHTTRHHLTLGFDQGAHLPDPLGLIEGTGKNLRHVKLPDDHPIDDDALRALLGEAWARAVS